MQCLRRTPTCGRFRLGGSLALPARADLSPDFTTLRKVRTAYGRGSPRQIFLRSNVVRYIRQIDLVVSAIGLYNRRIKKVLCADGKARNRLHPHSGLLCPVIYSPSH